MSDDVLSELDKQRIERTVSIREKLINELVLDSTGKVNIPRDKMDKVLLAQLLDGVDRTTLAKAKLTSDANAQQTQRDTTRMIAEVLMKTRAAMPSTRVETPLLDDSFRVVDLVPGEADIDGHILRARGATLNLVCHQRLIG